LITVSEALGAGACTTLLKAKSVKFSLLLACEMETLELGIRMSGDYSCERQ
jgi:hypothetical protein